MMFIKDGNFTTWFRALIWISGLITAVLFYYFSTGKVMFWGVTISIFFAAIGAYSEKVNRLRLKPFDNSYKKAKESYKKEDKK